jgi:predicted neutral ceramidase superfamily lipid hydrolase
VNNVRSALEIVDSVVDTTKEAVEEDKEVEVAEMAVDVVIPMAGDVEARNGYIYLKMC